MKNKAVDYGLIGSIAIIVIMALAFVGWCMNAYKLTQCDFEAPYKCEVIRAAGIFMPPVGAIAGYVDIRK